MHTHTGVNTHSEHTPRAVGSYIAEAPGFHGSASWGLLKGLTSVVVFKVEKSTGYSLQNQNGLIIKVV